MAEVTGNGNGNNKVAVPQAGEVSRADFGSTSLERKAETSSTALAAQATAAVQARYVIALQRPRDWEVVRVALIKACKRPLFAQDAIYAKPMGGDTIQGPSIRFAEEAARAMTNILAEVAAIYDDSKKRIVRVTATDLESNLTFYKDVNVEKTVERKHPKPGTQILGQRQNSYGDPVFLVGATDDETATKEAALCSKAMRELLMRLLPSDIKEDAFAQIRETRHKEDAEHPDAAKRRVIDGFYDMGVDPKQLADFIGHDLGTLNPAELQRLRLIYSGLKDGETTWADVMAQKRDIDKEREAKTPAAGAPAAAAAPKGKAPLSDLAASAKAKREARPGQQTIPTKPAATDPLARVPAPAPAREVGADDDDAVNRAAAAPTDDELPSWMNPK